MANGMWAQLGTLPGTIFQILPLFCNLFSQIGCFGERYRIWSAVSIEDNLFVILARGKFGKFTPSESGISSFEPFGLLNHKWEGKRQLKLFEFHSWVLQIFWTFCTHNLYIQSKIDNLSGIKKHNVRNRYTVHFDYISTELNSFECNGWKSGKILQIPQILY